MKSGQENTGILSWSYNKTISLSISKQMIQPSLTQHSPQFQTYNKYAFSSTPHTLELELLKYIQFLQHTKTPGKINQLITAVQASFEKLHNYKNNNILMILQNMMELWIFYNEIYNYNLSHIYKVSLEQDVLLLASIKYTRGSQEP